jgi:type I restriction enzyme S subunit
MKIFDAAKYKQTEIGMIPVDWDLLRLDDICSIATGKKDVNEGSSDGEFPFFTCSRNVSKSDTYSFEGESILIAGNGDVGNLHYTDGRFEAYQRTYILQRFGISARYLWHQLDAFFKKSLGIGTIGTSIPYIKRENIADFIFALPKKEAEQSAIVSALSDADALISKLEVLLQKKKLIKQGAMQELLTGKRRLPGFSGEWEKKKLGDLAKIKTGSRNNQDKVEGGQYPFFVRSANVERINDYSYDCEAVLVPGEGNIGKIFHYIIGRFDVHQRVYAITSFIQEVSGRFIFYYMDKNFGVHAMQNTVKATVDSLRLPTFENFELVLPPTKKEQVAIASVLSDIDMEIENLESKLSKYQDLKQGMMQVLLTGKIRLI